MTKSRAGFYFVLPWVLGFAIFTIVPMLSAVYISMTDWSIVGNAGFIGIKITKNYFNPKIFIIVFGLQFFAMLFLLFLLLSLLL